MITHKLLTNNIITSRRVNCFLKLSQLSELCLRILNYNKIQKTRAINMIFDFNQKMKVLFKEFIENYVKIFLIFCLNKGCNNNMN